MSISPARAQARLKTTAEALAKAEEVVAKFGVDAILAELNKASADLDAAKEHFTKVDETVKKCKADLDAGAEGAQLLLDGLKPQYDEALAAVASRNDIRSAVHEKFTAASNDPSYVRAVDAAYNLSVRMGLQAAAVTRRVTEYPGKLARHLRRVRTNGFVDQKGRTNTTVKTAREEAAALVIV